jgi:hypothetical protein
LPPGADSKGPADLAGRAAQEEKRPAARWLNLVSLNHLSLALSLHQFVKYDPVVRRHVLFTETKLK